MNPFSRKLKKALLSRRKAVRQCRAGSFARAEDFVSTFELVPARASRGRAIDEIMAFVRDAASDGMLSALSVTDNAGGHPALTAISLSREIMNLGIEPVIHFSCKDRNRNTMESQLFELDRAELRNLLVMTGDYPRQGFSGFGKPVFDLDSVQALEFIRELGHGMRYAHRSLRIVPVPFNAGCVVTPFKRLEAEQAFQYAKLVQKIRAGASYVVSQLGFDACRHHELRQFIDTSGLNIPLLGTVMIIDVRLAGIMHRGLVPGCVMPQRLLEQIKAEAARPDGGRAAALERAARQIALLQGMGYEGVHMSGPGLSYSTLVSVLERVDAIKDRWQEYVRDFLYPEEWRFRFYKQDPVTGLNQSADGDSCAVPGRDTSCHGKYSLSLLSPLERFVHKMVFTPGGGIYDQVRRLARRISGSRFEAPFTRMEYLVKGILYNCQHCGDCTLSEMEFMCPQSQCAKFMLNGPCGGSSDGWCEVWPGKRRCMYVMLYERLEDPAFRRLRDREYLPPRNWALFRSSSWLNFFLDKDHRGLTGKK